MAGIEDQIFQQQSDDGIHRQDVSGYEAPEISPKEVTEHLAQRVAAALEQTGLIEIVKVQANLVNQIHIMARVHLKDERKVANEVIYNILRRTEGVCKQHMGKQFLLKNERMAYALVFSFGSDDIRKAAHAVCDAITEVMPPMEVIESPLMGGGTPQSGGRKSGKKGAAPVAPGP